MPLEVQQEYYNTLVNMRRYAFDIAAASLQGLMHSAEYSLNSPLGALRALEGLERLIHAQCVAIVQLMEWHCIDIPLSVRDEYLLDAPYYNCGLVDDH